MSKASKTEAQYVAESPNREEKRCYICTMFRPSNGCTAVRGKISPDGLCKWFELDKRFGPGHSQPVLFTKGVPTVDKSLMFLPITKVDAVNHLVYGIATEEAPDRSHEIFDYAKSKPFYQAWSDEISKATDGKSLGNIRAMHSKIAAGKVTELTFNDAQKRVEICAKIVDDNEWNKVVEGVYTGFSQGGEYVERFPDPHDATLKRYVAKPTEISLVDLPCLPTATFQLIKSAGPVPEVEIRGFKSIDNEAGIAEAFDKWYTGELEKHMPGRVMTVNEADKPSDDDKNVGGTTSNHARASEPGAPATPATDHVDNREDAEPKEGKGPHGHEPGTAQGQGEGVHQEEVDQQIPSSVKETKNVEAGDLNKDTNISTSTGATDSAAGGSTKEDSDASARNALRQVWLAEDGKPFIKKQDALDHNLELAHQKLAKEASAPLSEAMAALRAAVDKVDGGELQIKNPQDMDHVWQKCIEGVQTRAGVIPIGKVYNSVDDLPPAVKQHFADPNKQRQWMHVWNNAYKNTKDEKRAFAEAWSAAEKAQTQVEFDKALEAKKARGTIEYADPGYQRDGKQRFPLDCEKHIRASWAFIHMPVNAGKYQGNHLNEIRGKIAKAMQALKIEVPDASKLAGVELAKEMAVQLRKHLYDVGDMACTILSLHRLHDSLAMEAIREGDDSELPQQLKAHIAGLCMFLRNMVDEETEELMQGTEDMTGVDDDGDTAINVFIRDAVGPNAQHLADTFNKVFTPYWKEREEYCKVKGLRFGKGRIPKFIAALEKAGKKMGQVNRMHLQAAHDHISAMADGAMCKDGVGIDKAGGKHSKATMEALNNIHDHMGMLGAECTMGKAALLRHTEEEVQSFEKSAGMASGALEKLVDQNAALKKALDDSKDDMVKLTKRVEEIAAMPEPAKGLRMIPPGTHSVEKASDTGVMGRDFTYNGQAGNSAIDSYAEHLNKLTPEERALELIKLAQRNPRQVSL